MAEYSIENRSGLMEQIQHYWHVVLKWKWISLIFFLTVVTGVTVYSFLKTPVYTASGSVWIEGEPNILPFEELQTFGVGINQQSHARLLKSQTLAAEVIENLKLYENPDFIWKVAGENGSIDTSDPAFRNRLIEIFLKSITVSPVERTSLLDVKFSSKNPTLAAEVLNALFDSYIDMLVRKRFTASEQATEFLNTQIAALQTDIDEREKELSKYGSERNILPLTNAETPTITRLEELNRALTAATIERINKLNYYNQINSAPLEEISDPSATGLIQSLRMQYAALSREYSKRLGTLRPEYPEMLRLKSEMDEARQALLDEKRNLINAAYSDYLTALEGENSLKKELEEQKNEVYKTSSQSVIYNSLRIEIENQKNLLETLSKRRSETGVSSRLIGMEAMNVWIVDQATPPLNPESPKKKKNVLVGFLIGLVGGLGLALGINYLDQTVKTSRDVVTSTDFHTLGAIPSFDAQTNAKGPRSEFKRLVSIVRGNSTEEKKKEKRKKEEKSERTKLGLNLLISDNPRTKTTDKDPHNHMIELIALRKPQSIQSESYRSIRTSLLSSCPPGKIKSILVTSPLAREGKSSTVSNLGITLAKADMRVVIVDSDLRKPNQNKIFGFNSGLSLNQYLKSHGDLKDLVKLTPIPNLCLIKSEPVSGSPIELLTSERMKNLVMNLKQVFQYVLFDTPPILAFSDALAMGSMVDGIILVARGGQTPMQAMKQAKQKLDAHNLDSLGVILNDVNLIEQDGYYARQYYNYYNQE